MESLEQLMELAKSKKNVLEISDIDKFLKDKNISVIEWGLTFKYRLINKLINGIKS